MMLKLFRLLVCLLIFLPQGFTPSAAIQLEMQ
jgi:hypothetical protein